MKLAIIGSRGFDNYVFVERTLDRLFGNSKIDLIISGKAKGADTLGQLYSTNKKIPFKPFPPDWDTYGKGAGFKRNRDIIEACDVVIAFWDGVSRGTEQALTVARELRRHTVIVYV